MFLQFAFEFMYGKQLFDFTYRHQRKRDRYYLRCAINNIIIFMRAILASVSVKSEFDYFQFDSFANFALEEMNRNLKLFFSLVPIFMLLCVFLFVINFLFYRTENFIIMDIAFDLYKTNADDFHESNNLVRPLQLNIYKVKLIQFLSEHPKLERWLCLDSQGETWRKYQNIKFTKKLNFFCFLSKSNRLKVLVAISVLEAFLTLSFFQFFLFFLFISVGYMVKNVRASGVLFAIWAAVDLAWIGWDVAWESIKMSYIMLCNSVILCGTFIVAFGDLTKQIQRRFNTENAKTLFLQNHAKVTKVVLQTGDENLSMLMYTFIVINIPISVIFLTYIIYANISTIFRTMIIMVVFMITVAFLVTLVPPALVNRASHKPSKIMPRIQQEIKANNLRLKIKYMSYYEQLTSNKIGFKVGPFGTITINIIVEVFFCRLFQ